MRIMTRLSICALLLAACLQHASAQEWQSYQLTNFTAYGDQVRQCGSVADTFGNLHHYLIGQLGQNGIHQPLLYMRTDFYGHILTDTVCIDDRMLHPVPYFTGVVGDGNRSWCVWSDRIPTDSTHWGLFMTGRDASGQSFLPQTFLGRPAGGEGPPDWNMGITLRQADSTIHVVGVSYPDFYYRFTTHAETLMWQRSIDGLVWGEAPKIHLGPDGVPWAAMHSEPGGGASEVQLVRFGEDTSQTVFWPFRGNCHHWNIYDFGIDAVYNFHFMLSNDTAAIAYARLDSSRHLQEWRTFQPTGYAFGGMKTDSAGNSMFVWDLDPGLFWAYRRGDGTWEQPPMLIDATMGGVSFSIVTMDGERFAFTAAGHPRAVGFLQLQLYTLGYPPDDAAPEPHAAAPVVSLIAYPNPFNPSTTLTFGVPKTSNISLEVFDILGRKTQTLYSGLMQAGQHQVLWNCPTCPSGMYFVRMQAGGQTMQRKMLLLK